MFFIHQSTLVTLSLVFLLVFNLSLAQISPLSNTPINQNNQTIPNATISNANQSLAITNRTSNVTLPNVIISNTSTPIISNLTNSSTSNKFQTKDESDQDYLNQQLHLNITVPIGILGALFIATGTPMAFWGSRNRWSSYFLTGGYVSSAIIMIPILRFGVIEQDHRPTPVVQGLFLVACVISALLAGAVAVIFWKGTRFLVGASGGFVLSLYILSLKSNALIEALGFRWIFITLSTSLGFILMTIPQLSILASLFSTAIVGSAVLGLGVDCFTTGGLKEFWLFILGFSGLFDPNLKSRFPITVTMQAELGVMAGVFCMGSAVQWRLLEVIKKKINQLKQLDREREFVEEAAAYRQSMALESDLARWEKRYGPNAEDDDEADSRTMLESVVAHKPGHQTFGSGKGGRNTPGGRESYLNSVDACRPSSQFSLLTHQLSEEIALPGDAYLPLPNRSSNDHLPMLETSLEFTGSLGVKPEKSTLDGPQKELEQKMQTLEQVRKLRASVEKLRAELATSPQASPPAVLSASPPRSPNIALNLSSTSNQSRPQVSHVVNSNQMVKIDFEKFEGDRKVSRPPGTPKTWKSTTLSPNLMNSDSPMIPSDMDFNKPYRHMASFSSAGSPPASLRPVSYPDVLMQAIEQAGGKLSEHSPDINRYSKRPVDISRRKSEQILNGLNDHQISEQRKGEHYTPHQRRQSSYSHYHLQPKRESRGFIDLNEPTDRMGRPLPLEEMKKIQSHHDSRSLSGLGFHRGPDRIRSTSLNSSALLTTSSPRAGSSSQAMTIEELDQRHRLAMRKMQGPANHHLTDTSPPHKKHTPKREK